MQNSYCDHRNFDSVNQALLHDVKFYLLDERVEQLPTKCATVSCIKNEPGVLSVTWYILCFDLGCVWLCCYFGRVRLYYNFLHVNE